jgi:hypothetical protein
MNDDVVRKPRSRYGSAAHNDRYAAKLHTLRRRDGQDLQDLYNEVCKLMALAYPGTARTRLNDAFAREAFNAALNNRELEIKFETEILKNWKWHFELQSRLRVTYRLGWMIGELIEKPDHPRPRRERQDEQYRARHIQNKSDGDSGSVSLKRGNAETYG